MKNIKISYQQSNLILAKKICLYFGIVTSCESLTQADLLLEKYLLKIYR